MDLEIISCSHFDFFPISNLLCSYKFKHLANNLQFVKHNINRNENWIQVRLQTFAQDAELAYSMYFHLADLYHNT